MTDAILGLPPHVRQRLAKALESGALGAGCTLTAVRSVLGLREGAETVVGALAELQRHGISGPASAAWLRMLEESVRRTRKPDLVWSGPEVPGVGARRTRQVYEELVGAANHTIWASTFAYFDGPRAFEPLAKRMSEVPGLRIMLLLNIQRRWGDTTAADHLVSSFADRFWGRDWPGSSRPMVYYDPRSLELDGAKGVLHAKAIVTDDESVFITSANLTEAAHDRNIEIGLLVRDPALALSVTSHFRALVDQRLLRPLPTKR